MLKEITIKTNTQTQILDITAQVQKVVGESGIAEGLCCVFIPHTTAGVIINENAEEIILPSGFTSTVFVPGLYLDKF